METGIQSSCRCGILSLCCRRLSYLVPRSTSAAEDQGEENSAREARLVCKGVPRNSCGYPLYFAWPYDRFHLERPIFLLSAQKCLGKWKHLRCACRTIYRIDHVDSGYTCCFVVSSSIKLAWIFLVPRYTKGMMKNKRL